MSNNDVFPVSPEIAGRAWVDEAKYNEMYAQSVKDPDAFWGEHGKLPLIHISEPTRPY